MVESTVSSEDLVRTLMFLVYGDESEIKGAAIEPDTADTSAFRALMLTAGSIAVLNRNRLTKEPTDTAFEDEKDHGRAPLHAQMLVRAGTQMLGPNFSST